jgi:XcyI restriction endonuclease
VPISIPAPQLQIDFAFALEQIRGLYLQHALSEAVGKLDIKNIDAELARIVPSASLTQLATRGLRGELMFAVCPALVGSAAGLLDGIGVDRITRNCWKTLPS